MSISIWGLGRVPSTEEFRIYYETTEDELIVLLGQQPTLCDFMEKFHLRYSRHDEWAIIPECIKAFYGEEGETK